MIPHPKGVNTDAVWQLQQRIREQAKAFVARHGRKLWWLHSLYALALGAFVVAFAQKGFEHARWLSISIGIAWLLVVMFFRLFGGDASRVSVDRTTKARVFFVMSYALKNLYQGMLFFLLPFYYKSTTFDAPNVWFVCLLGGCAVVSTLDLVFDRVLLRFRALASMFHATTLFAVMNLLIPALLPNTRTLISLLSAAFLTVVSFWTLHVRASALKKRRNAVLFLASLAAGVFLAYAIRRSIPPVPMHLSSAAVGHEQLPDGRLTMEVRSLHFSVIRQLIAVTDVVVPGGKGDQLVHVWRHDGAEVHHAAEDTSRVVGPFGAVRLRSGLTEEALPSNLVGRWTIDVETEDGQLVGRVPFTVTE
jgi:Family of unknown function (DUF5924)/Protein of unknown function (DUF2914)